MPGRNVADVVAEIRKLRDTAVILDRVRNRVLAEFLGAEGDGPPELLVQFSGEVPHLVDRDAVNAIVRDLLKRPAISRRRARALLRGLVTVSESETVGTPADPNQEGPLLPVSAQARGPSMERDRAVDNTWQLAWPPERGDGTGRGR